MANRSLKECREVTEVALWSCANSCAVTMDVHDALKMADATEKLSQSLLNLSMVVEESEDK